MWYIDNYLNDVVYRNDRAVDTIATITSLEVILISLLVYSTERIESRRRETALLRAMGSDRKLVAKIQISELLAIMLFCILNILIFTPSFIIYSVYSINITAITFPVKLIVEIPWIQLWGISIFFAISVVILISFISVALSRINLTLALNAAWTESGPLRE